MYGICLKWLRGACRAAGCALLLALFATDAAAAAALRYDRASNRIYVSGGSVTLSAIHSALPRAPLERIDADGRIWLLRANLQIENGAGLRLHGSELGGDVDELRLFSANEPGPHAYASITADHGTIDIRSTRIISWDPATEGPDTEYGRYGRAYVRARSRLSMRRVQPLESRMDVIDSEIAYLGYGSPEAYGLAWKVNASHPYGHDTVRVRGNIINSRIHHNFFGVYAFGAENAVWRNNEIYNNVQYGLAPHNHSDRLLIEKNNVHHNGSHGIMAWMHCNDLVIRDNRTWANARNGIIIRRSSQDAEITGNKIYRNGESGITVFASDRAQIRDNLLLMNGHAGVELAVGSSDARVINNQLGYNGGAAFYVYKGHDAPEPSDDGRPRRNQIADNVVYGTGGAPVVVVDADQSRFTRNTVQLTGLDWQLDRSRGTLLADNDLPTDVIVAKLWPALEGLQPLMRGRRPIEPPSDNYVLARDRALLAARAPCFHRLAQDVAERAPWQLRWLTDGCSSTGVAGGGDGARPASRSESLKAASRN